MQSYSFNCSQIASTLCYLYRFRDNATVRLPILHEKSDTDNCADEFSPETNPTNVDYLICEIWFCKLYLHGKPRFGCGTFLFTKYIYQLLLRLAFFNIRTFQFQNCRLYSLVPNIIFEDVDLLAVNKPAGLLVIPDRYRKDLPNLRDLLVTKYGNIFVVHRLDKETSGILIFAKNAATHKHLNDQFTGHTIEKVYLALVRGRLEHAAGAIKFPLAPHPKKPALMVVSQAGKISITDYNVREVFKDYTLVEARPHTGRLHQVRIHFAALGHPLAFDRGYGNKEPILLSSIKPDYKPSGKSVSLLIDRLTLHAEKITFIHPSTGHPQTLTAPLPKDFEVLIQQLRKYNR